MILRQSFKITGVASDIQYDTGLTSTPTERKRIVSIWAILSGLADNELQIYHEKAKVQAIPDRLLDYEALADVANQAKPGARINDIEVGIEIPIGEVVKVAIKCGPTAKDVYGTYNYELIAG